MFKRAFFIYFIIFVPNSSCMIEPLYNLAKEVQRYYSLINQVNFYNIIDNSTVDTQDPWYLELKDLIDKIYNEINKTECSINSKIIPSLPNVLNSNIVFIRILDTFDLHIASIDDDYRKFNDYIANNQLKKIRQSIILNIVPNILMIRDIITDFERFVPNHNSLIAVITHIASERRHEICDNSQLISEVLIQIFRTVIIAEIKTHVMMGFSNKYQQIDGDYYAGVKGWTELNSIAFSQFKKYFAQYVKILTENLGVSDHLYLRACDPQNGNWILDDNYFEFRGTVRAMIFRYSLKDCSPKTCDAVGFDALVGCHAYYYEHWDECPNKLVNCIDLGSTEACMTLGRPRRLKYVNSRTMGFFGSHSQCSSHNSILLDDESIKGRVSSSCSCDCFENSSKISLKIMGSRIESNRIITGLRFIRRNNILHIQIKEGLLEAQGYINPMTNKWRPIPYSIDPSQIHSINRENRIFFLDDLRLPREYLLTGIQFEKMKRGAVEGFEIGIYGVEFNYTTGQLNILHKIRLSMGADVQVESLFFERINSVGTITPHKPTLDKGKYIELERSFLSDDFGQSTLPLFDAVPVTTDPPSILNGVGIFHKGLDDHAGFISLRLYGLKYKQYFDNFESAHIINENLILN